MMEEHGITVRARLRGVGWVEFVRVRTFEVGQDGWIRVYQIGSATTIVINPDDVIMIGAAKNFETV